MSYLGAKSGSGTFQAIIALMPPHETYVEPFLGSGAIMLKKAPAQHSIGIDLDSDAVRHFSEAYPSLSDELFTTDALDYLANTKFDQSTLIYCDPPYVHSTRTSNHKYKHELKDFQHMILLKTLKSLDCMVMISGYHSPLYERTLSDWFSTSFQSMTRGGVRTEYIWCNFQPGDVHYHTYAGKNRADRQRIKRKAERWASNYQLLPPAERQAILAAILSARVP